MLNITHSVSTNNAFFLGNLMSQANVSLSPIHGDLINNWKHAVFLASWTVHDPVFMEDREIDIYYSHETKDFVLFDGLRTKTISKYHLNKWMMSSAGDTNVLMDVLAKLSIAFFL